MKLGAWGSDLGAIAGFFETPWNRVLPAFTEFNQAGLLNKAALDLQALGRLAESQEPMRASLAMCVQQEQWRRAAIGASNLSDLDLTMGEVALAVADSAQSVTDADRSDDTFTQIVN